MRMPPWMAVVVLLVAVAGGTYVRLWPSLPPRGTEFLADGATVARLALESAETLRLPAVDSLAEAPRGRALAPVFSPGLIVSAGAFHRMLAALGSRDANFDLALFGALAGGLIAVPVFLWARVQWGAGVAAPFAALLIAFLPAHLHRTFGYLLRYEAPGSLLVASHLACLAAALRAESRPMRLLLAALAAGFLIAALWVWRVPLIVPLIEAGLLALWLAARGSDAAERETFAVSALLVTPGLFALEYLRTERFVTSAPWLAALAVAAVAWVPRLARGRAAWIERTAWVAGALLAGVAAGTALGGGSSYASTGALLATRLAHLTGSAAVPDPLTRLMLGIEELGTIPPPALVAGATHLALAGPWLVASPLVFWLAASRPPRLGLDRLSSASWLLAAVTAALFVLAVFVYRAKVLLAPAAAVVVAGVLQALLAESGWSTAKRSVRVPIRRAPRELSPRERRAAQREHFEAEPGPEGRPFGRTLFALALLVSLLGNLWFSGVIAATRESRLPPGELAALDWLRQNTPPDAIVATLWEYGFEVQSYAGRRTLMDGFLESTQGRERMLGFARAGFERSTTPLAEWCRAHGARWVLVPPSTQLTGLALLAEPRLVPVLQSRTRLRPEEANRTIVRMMVFGPHEPPFYKVFDRDLWRVYALDDSTGAIRTAPSPFQ